MKRIVLSFALLISITVCASAQDLEKHKYYGLGSAREYYLYNPQDIAPGAPLVILLHGYGGDATKYRPEMLELAKKYRFALCIPQGAKDPSGKKGWNVRYPSQAGMKSNDVNFIVNLAKKLQKQYGFSKANTFLSGMSNGGDIGYVIAWQHPEAFAAIASVAGLTFEWLIDENFPRGSVPFMEIHGTEDRTSEWMGDHENKGGWGSYASVPVGIAYMIAANKCKAEETIEFPLLDPEKPSRKVYLHRYYGGINDSEVLLYEVIGGNHSWHLKDIDTCEEIWKFFSKYITDENGARIYASPASQTIYADARGTIEEEPYQPAAAAASKPEVTPAPVPAPAPVQAPSARPSSYDAMADDIIEEASKYLGTPYRYAGSGPNAFDCSGFTSFIFKKFGYTLPHSSSEQGKVGKPVSQNDLRRGDIVLFNGSRVGGSVGHVGIVVDVKYDNSFTFIHSAIKGGVIISDSLEPYYSSRYKGARRILHD